MNINEIAEMAGVSRATVSRYLNNGYVSKEKREKIREVIEKTGYQPSTQAQTLRTRKTKLVGVILPKINSDSVSRMVAGISEILNKNNYRIILANTANQVEEELKYLALFQENQVDGVILIGTIFTKRHLKLISEYKVPIVILGQKLEGYACVYQDELHACQDLMEKMGRTAKEIAYVGVTQKDEAARELIETNPGIDTIFCATDTIAVGVFVYLREQNIAVPDQIQLAGVGDTTIGRVMDPSLTSIHYFYKTSGKEAARMMVELLENTDAVRKEIQMGYEIKIRKSTRP